MSNLVELQKNFINLRLGSFIHFNSATMQFNTGDIEDWEFFHENGQEPRRFPFNEKDWNPDQLDCRQWAETAKAAGLRFMALTTKHHEGFCLWPTKYSEHCVRNATNKTDVVAEYLKAFREVGITAGLYFSILDLTAQINRKGCTDDQKAMIKGQITELLTNYGEIPFLFVDGWNSPWGGPRYDMLSFEEIDSLVKSLQPNCLLLNIGSCSGLRDTDIVCYENGAGQDVNGEFHGPGILCQKLTKTWFWRETDAVTAPRDAKYAVRLMEKYFPMNINVILNFSPNKHGRLDDNLAAEFVKLGELVKLPEPITELPEGWAYRE